jgi:hypothetical protein
MTNSAGHGHSQRDVLIYTVHKAASSFLHRLAVRVSTYFGMYHYAINRDNHKQFQAKSWKGVIESEDACGCFGPIRLGAAEPCVPDLLERYSIVAHMRDPRDVLTSLFFSHTYSHNRGLFDPGDATREEWEKKGIDRYVLERCAPFKKRYATFCSHLSGRQNVLVLKYEDLVTDYGGWLEKFLTAFSDWADQDPKERRGRVNVRSLEAAHGIFYEKFHREFQAVKEDIYSHRRQLTPGDHVRKLRPDTIKQLNGVFADSLATLGYAA